MSWGEIRWDRNGFGWMRCLCMGGGCEGMIDGCELDRSTGQVIPSLKRASGIEIFDFFICLFLSGDEDEWIGWCGVNQ